jgi:hypothetical protein
LSCGFLAGVDLLGDFAATFYFGFGLITGFLAAGLESFTPVFLATGFLATGGFFLAADFEGSTFFKLMDYFLIGELLGFGADFDFLGAS